MSTTDEIIREYHEAAYGVKSCLVRELEKLDHVRDRDVRNAKANLAVPEELHKRLLAATIAFDQLKAGREERWIAAHEDKYSLFKEATES